MSLNGLGLGGAFVSIRRCSGVLTVSLILVVFFSACGSSDKKDTASTQPNTSTAQASLADFKGVYVATLKNPELANAAGPRARWPTGLWRMAFGTRDPKTARTPGKAVVEFSPGQFELSVLDLKDGRITFAPDRTCDTVKGRTQNSVFTITKTSTGVGFTPVTPSCKSDAAVLTLGRWRGP
jgi:hypothetical protein